MLLTRAKEILNKTYDPVFMVKKEEGLNKSNRRVSSRSYDHACVLEDCGYSSREIKKKFFGVTVKGKKI
jgi:hypothetical protein